MSGWSKGFVSLMALLMLGGCANTAMKEEVRRKDRKIKSLNAELGLLREKNDQVARERDAYRSKFQSSSQALDAHKTTQMRTQQLLASKDDQIAVLKRSQPSRRPSARSSGSAGKSSKVARSSGPKGRYHLRIISLPDNSHNRKVVQDIASFLKSRGIQEVVPRKSGKFWVVDIGHFQSIRTSEARDLKKTVRSMRYKGIRQFKDAIYVPY